MRARQAYLYEHEDKLVVISLSFVLDFVSVLVYNVYNIKTPNIS